MNIWLNYCVGKIQTKKSYLCKRKKKDLLSNAKNIYDGSKMIINPFKDKIFPLNLEGFPERKVEMKMNIKFSLQNR